MDDRFLQEGFNKCLAHVIEEMGEALSAAGKTQRWGRESVNPLLAPARREANEDWLRRELQDVKDTIARLELAAGWTKSPVAQDAGDVSSLIAARLLAADGALVDCPVCGAVDRYRAGQQPAAPTVQEHGALIVNAVKRIRSALDSLQEDRGHRQLDKIELRAGDVRLILATLRTQGGK